MNPNYVYQIFTTVGDVSQVGLDQSVFSKIVGISPQLPFKTAQDAKGNAVKVFDVLGSEVISFYDKETRKSRFFMKSDDASKRVPESAVPNGQKLALDISAFPAFAA